MAQDVIPDIGLIENIKKYNSSESLIELNNRHSALCYSVYEKYIPILKETGKYVADITDCQLYVVYQSAKSYDEKFNVKFSTHLANNIMYQCLHAIDNKPWQTIPISTETQNHAEPSWPQFPITEQKVYDNSLEVALELLQELEDKRIAQIYKMRFVDGLTYHEIGNRINLSTQHVTNLFRKGKKYLREKLKSEFIS